jgi:hypothetical protein
VSSPTKTIKQRRFVLRFPTYWFAIVSMTTSRSSSGSTTGENPCAGSSRMVHCLVAIPFEVDDSRTR